MNDDIRRKLDAEIEAARQHLPPGTDDPVQLHCPICRHELTVAERFTRPQPGNCTGCLLNRKRIVQLVLGTAPKPEEN